ncbi:MAG TPA: DUF642 domain-containing protein [bacterium]|nr:DUF642 domain-containing protein [bacterium]
MRSLLAVGALRAVACALVTAPVQAATVLVEDFESPDTVNFIVFTIGEQIVTDWNTWNVTGGSIDLYEAAARVEAAAFDGAQAIDLAGSPGAGMLETTFATTPGMAYELVFHYARNAFLGAETGDAEVDVVGAGSLLEATIQHDPALYEFDVYLEFSALFTADSTEAILRFTSLDTGNTGITLDGICISAVPSVGVGEAIRPAPWSRVKAAFRD